MLLKLCFLGCGCGKSSGSTWGGLGGTPVAEPTVVS